MDSLPDEVLVRVFALLPAGPRDLLLGVRGVCRRWRALAVHPELWRRRDAMFLWMSGLRKETPCVRDPFVRYVKDAAWIASLAPCVRWMSLSSYLLVERPDVRRALLSSGCAAQDLTLSVEHRGSGHSARLLQRQLALGRLRRLTLTLSETYTLEKFLTTIFANSQLTDLELYIIFNGTVSNLPPVLVDNDGACLGGSLKSLKLSLNPYYEEGWPSDGTDLSMAALSLLLRGSSSTLEKVWLEYSGPEESLAPAAALLGQCPQLRELLVPARYLPTCWPHCPQLARLELDMKRWGDADHAALGALFRGATRLTSLSFQSGHLQEVLPLVSALASGGAARLQSLHVGCDQHWVADDRNALLSALARLPRLTTLSFGRAPPVDLLEALPSQTAVRLQLLSITDALFCPTEPPRCYFAVLLDLMRRMPGLHIADLEHCHRGGPPPDSDDDEVTVPVECVCHCCVACPPPLKPYLEHLDKIGLCGCPAGRGRDCSVRLRCKGLEWVPVGSVL